MNRNKVSFNNLDYRCNDRGESAGKCKLNSRNTCDRWTD